MDLRESWHLLACMWGQSSGRTEHMRCALRYLAENTHTADVVLLPEVLKEGDELRLVRLAVGGLPLPRLDPQSASGRGSTRGRRQHRLTSRSAGGVAVRLPPQEVPLLGGLLLSLLLRRRHPVVFGGPAVIGTLRVRRRAVLVLARGKGLLDAAVQCRAAC